MYQIGQTLYMINYQWGDIREYQIIKINDKTKTYEVRRRKNTGGSLTLSEESLNEYAYTSLQRAEEILLNETVGILVKFREQINTPQKLLSLLYSNYFDNNSKIEMKKGELTREKIKEFFDIEIDE